VLVGVLWSVFGESQNLRVIFEMASEGETRPLLADDEVGRSAVPSLASATATSTFDALPNAASPSRGIIEEDSVQDIWASEVEDIWGTSSQSRPAMGAQQPLLSSPSSTGNAIGGSSSPDPFENQSSTMDVPDYNERKLWKTAMSHHLLHMTKSANHTNYQSQ
jgi:hypothetical protein